jgi:hypothetical protein
MYFFVLATIVFLRFSFGFHLRLFGVVTNEERWIWLGDWCSLMPEKRKQNDDWNRYSKQPEKNSSTHDRLLYVSWCENAVVPGWNNSCIRLTFLPVDLI